MQPTAARDMMAPLRLMPSVRRSELRGQVITIEGKTYRLCLLDTNFLSLFLKDPAGAPSRLIKRLDHTPFIFAVSLFTVVEISRRSELFDQLIKWFAVFPSVLLKSIHLLLDEEIRCYPNPSQVNPVLFSPVAVEPEAGSTREETLRKIFRNPTVQRLVDEMSQEREQILVNVLSLTRNFPRPERGYSQADARRFAAMVTRERVTAHAPAWAREQGQAPDPEAFPSLKASAYSAFFRFYSDGSRVPRGSDGLDLGIASGLPYVDLAALEADQANITRRVCRADPFISQLEVISLRDLGGAV